MPTRSLTALPVFNEVQSVDAVLDEVLRYSDSVLVVDDGSTDGTADRLSARRDAGLHVVSHSANRGYGAALRTAFQFAQDHSYDTIVTVDCDGQHEPKLIRRFIEASQSADIVSGSRYLVERANGSAPPQDRRRINAAVTGELNKLLGFQLTDAFCGFKAYRVSSLARLDLTEDGYAMPLELWVQAAFAGLEVVELEVPLIYLDANRSFGESLDNPETRLEHYRRVIQRSVLRSKRHESDCAPLCGESVG